MHSNATPARVYAPGIGDAVADRTINRIKADGTRETWEDVARRVAMGNSQLIASRTKTWDEEEFNRLHSHMRQASVLMSGRHLQHTDENIGSRNQEVLTNCLEGSTQILTIEHGPIAIEKIVDQVVTVIAGDGVLRPATINAHGIQPVNEITFRPNTGGGTHWRSVVRATANHRWKLRDGRITDELRVGDVLTPISGDVGIDPVAVVHGLVFGDGSGHKRRADHKNVVNSQGRTYATLRVCKQDAVRDEICDWLDAAGYRFTEPAHSNGDRVYYIGKFEHIKDVPHTTDPEYIAGFIYGWWLADGSKGVKHALEISTANEQAAIWLRKHAAFAGFTPTMHRIMERTETDGSFPNGKPLHCLRLRKGVEWKVDSIRPAGTTPVYCPEEPVTSTFVLADGMLTGNCSTSASSFILFYLLLNGSGVGRSYDDDMMLVNWNMMPMVQVVIHHNHPDVVSGEIPAHFVHMDLKDDESVIAYGSYALDTIVYEVPDSREGWAKAVEQIERMTFEGINRHKTLLIDFSGVRPRGAPIGGMQGRPASGPGPLMDALHKLAQLRDAGFEPFEAAMWADHYLAECVLVGGARRAARMATKTWRDKNVLKFVTIKKGGGLWSSNNSVTVDEEFWKLVKTPIDEIASTESTETLRLALHAKQVFEAICESSYHDGTGEPGLINVDKLVQKDKGVEVLHDGDYAESARFKLDSQSKVMTAALAKAFSLKQHNMIVNPCGEIPLSILGGYCVIADVVPFHAGAERPGAFNAIDNPTWAKHWDDNAEDAFRTAARALIRVNTMDSLYSKEVARTNRIGVGFTGIHSYAFARFGFGWKDLVNEKKSAAFWLMMARFSNATVDEANAYSRELGLNEPHTATTVKPAGTTSKLFGLEEGAHLPSMREYVRWVQFRYDDPLIEEYRAKGYPVRVLKTYSGTTIVGFPTVPQICTLGMGDKLVTAAEATPEEQYEWLRLLEKYWLHGHSPTIRGGEFTYDQHDQGGQVSYTLKYLPQVTDYATFRQTLLDGQSSVKCCSVMPQTEDTAYEYVPEQSVSKEEFERVVAGINTAAVREDVNFEHIDCAGGACPVDFLGSER